MRYVVAEGHWGGALEEGDGEGVWDGLWWRGCRGRECGSGVEEGLGGWVVEGVWWCEGDGFGFDEVRKFEDDGEVVEIWEVGGGRGGPSGVGDGAPDGRSCWGCRWPVGCSGTRCRVICRWRPPVLS